MAKPTTRKRNEALIALGSNLGDRAGYIEQALGAIARDCGPITRRAPNYQTQPVGNADQVFINSAAICATDLDAPQFLKRLLAIEKELGRERLVHWGNRTIDLDLILFKTGNRQLVCNSEDLVVPHPAALDRDFVMVPAAAVAPDWVHPQTHVSLKDTCRARRYKL